MTVLTRVRRSARRVRQTLQDFDNGPELLRAIASGRPDDLTFRSGELTVVCPNKPGARVPVYEIFAEDAYRLEWFTSDLGPAPVALDIGGHVGCFSLAFTGRHREATVHVFEASPTTGRYLARNIQANGRSGRVTVHHQAVSATAGTLRVAETGDGSGHNGVLHLGESGATAVEVECVSLADAFAAAGDDVDLVKIDVEGAEYDMILDSPAEVWAPVRRVVMEYHDMPGRSWSQLETFFAAVGLQVVARDAFTPRLGQAWLSRGPLP